MVILPDHHLCESKTFILEAIDQLESSVVQYFHISEKLIEAPSEINAHELNPDHELSLFKLACCLRSFFSYLIELQEILKRKKAFIMYTIPKESALQQTQLRIIHQNDIKHQNDVKTCLERNIKTLNTDYVSFKDMYLLKEQLEEYLNYYKLMINMPSVSFEEETYPEPAAPLLNIAMGSAKRKTNRQR